MVKILSLENWCQSFCTEFKEKSCYIFFGQDGSLKSYLCKKDFSCLFWNSHLIGAKKVYDIISPSLVLPPLHRNAKIHCWNHIFPLLLQRCLVFIIFASTAAAVMMHIFCSHCFFFAILPVPLVFCYQNCSDLLWEKIVLLIKIFFFFFFLGLEFAESNNSYHYNINSNGIISPKLFWPTVRRNCSSDWEKLLKFEFEAEGWEFSKFWDH